MPTSREIVEAWNSIEDVEPDISTEQLFARVCDHFNHEIDDGDVAAAIAEEEGATVLVAASGETANDANAEEKPLDVRTPEPSHAIDALAYGAAMHQLLLESNPDSRRPWLWPDAITGDGAFDFKTTGDRIEGGVVLGVDVGSEETSIIIGRRKGGDVIFVDEMRTIRTEALLGETIRSLENGPVWMDGLPTPAELRGHLWLSGMTNTTAKAPRLMPLTDADQERIRRAEQKRARKAAKRGERL